MADMIRSTTHRKGGNVQRRRGDNVLNFSTAKCPETVPEEVVEMIISRIPFPFLFKARLLSRTWYFKFPIAPQCIKSLSPSFQYRVNSVSSKWETYCPVYVGREVILGYDRTCSRWQALMDMSHLPIMTWSFVSSAGPLVGGMMKPKHPGDLTLLITNALTRGWRTIYFALPCAEPVALKIFVEGSDAYKVLLVFKDVRDNKVASLLYDSRSRIYDKTLPLEVTSSHICHASAYLDGKLYCMFRSTHPIPLPELWAFNVEENVWSAIPFDHSFVPNADYIDSVGVFDCGVVLCGDKVMVVTYNKWEEDDIRYAKYGLYTGEETIQILELDVVNLELKEVSLGPRREIFGVGLQDGKMKIASDSNFIYFGQPVPCTTVLSYNIQSHEWNNLPPAFYDLKSVEWTTDAFQPGLFPFLKV